MMGDLSAAEIVAVMVLALAAIGVYVWSLVVIDRAATESAERDRDRRINDWHNVGYSWAEAERIVGGQ